ncbi:MAG: DUF4493 domain-containing protein [Clostridia bacterium]|nr:DUF4493 domain-containing protein [Clostridia bacterium]
MSISHNRHGMRVLSVVVAIFFFFSSFSGLSPSVYALEEPVIDQIFPVLQGDDYLIVHPNDISLVNPSQMSAGLFDETGANQIEAAAAISISKSTFLKIDFASATNTPGIYTLKVWQDTGRTMPITVVNGGVIKVNNRLAVAPQIVIGGASGEAITVNGNNYGNWTSTDTIVLKLFDNMHNQVFSGTTPDANIQLGDNTLTFTTPETWTYPLAFGHYTIEVSKMVNSQEALLGIGIFDVQQNDPRELQSLAVNFDVQNKNNTYIEFVTKPSVDYGNAARLEMRLGGIYTTNPLTSNEVSGLLDPMNMRLVEINDNGTVDPADDTQLDIPLNSSHNFFRKSAMDLVGIEAQFNKGLIQPGKSYRLMIMSDFANTLISSITNAINNDDDQYQNLSLRLVDTAITNGDNLVAEKRSFYSPNLAPAARELSGVNSITLVGGNAVKYGVGAQGINDVKAVSLYFFDAFTGNELKSAYEAADASFAGTVPESITASVTANLAKLDITLAAAANLVNPVEDLNITGIAGADVSKVIDFVYKKQPGINPGKGYVVVKNTQNQIIGWKQINSMNNELITNPVFTVIDPDNLYQGFNHLENANIELRNTGIVSPRIKVDGKSVYNDGHDNVEIPFVLTFDSMQGMDGSYKINSHFVSDTEYQYPITLDPNQFYGDIPVKPAFPNAVTLLYKDNEGNVLASTTLDWTPGQGGNYIWDMANIPNNDYNSINSNPKIDIHLGGFTGNAANLFLDIKYYNETTGQNMTVAKLANVSLVSQQDDTKVFRFVHKAGDTNMLGQSAMNGQNVRVYLVYDDTVNSIHQEQEVRVAHVDNMPPTAFSEFGGIDQDGTYAGKYGLIVRYDSDINVNQLSVGKSVYFSLVKGDTTEVAPIAVVGYRDPQDMRTENHPYNNVKLYFESIQPGDSLKIQGVADSAGNIMTESFVMMIHMNIRVTGTVRDAQGNPIPYASINLVQPNSLLDSGKIGTSGTAASPGANKGPRMEYIGADGQGKFDRHIPLGTYNIYKIGYNTPNGEWRQTSLDQDLVLPISAVGQTYNFDVSIPQHNVSGTVEKAVDAVHGESLVFLHSQYLQAPWTELSDPYFIYEVLGKEAPVDTVTGNFSLHLKPGTYKLLGKKIGFSIVPPMSETVVEVPQSGNVVLPGTITFPAMNLKGTVKDTSGVGIGNVGVIIVKSGSTGMPSVVESVYGGSFVTALGEGSYTIKGLMPMWGSSKNGGLYAVNIGFNVNSQGVVQNVTGCQVDSEGKLQVVLPKPNVTVKVAEGGVVVTHGTEIGFDFVNSNGTAVGLSKMHVGSQNGQFDFYLEPGTLTINSVKVMEKYVENLNKQIMVAQGTNLTGANAVTVDLSQESNVIITFTDESGNPVENVGVPVNGKNNFYNGWGKTNSQGKIYYNLKAGNYVIQGYDQNGMWKELRHEFTVTVENTKANPVNIPIVVKAPNVTGVVRDGEGNPLVRSWVNIKKLPSGTELFSQYFGFNTDDNGSFAINLEAGEYVVEGIGTPTGWEEINFKFFVVDNNGTLEVRLTPNGTAQTSLTIAKSPNNLQGHVYKTYDPNTQTGTPYTGRINDPYYTSGQPIDVWLVVREQGIPEETFRNAPWIYEKWIEVKADGSFGKTLDATKTYEARAIVNAGKFIELNPPTAITLPATGLLIVPPAPNFSGVVKDFDGNPVTKGWMEVQKSDYTQFLGLDVAEDGTFGASLTDGADYIVKSVTVFSPSGDPWRDGKRIELNKIITAGIGTQNMTLKPNVKGSINLGGEIQTGDTAAAGSGKVGLIIRPVLSSENPNYGDSKINPWKYEKWVEMSYDSGLGAYTFTTSLENGEYILAGIPSPTKWIELNQSFSIGGATAGIVTYDPVKENYTLSLNFTPNVTGTVLDASGQAVAEAWLNFEKIVAQEPTQPTAWDPSRYFGTSTDLSGQFELNLSDGDYRISGYSTKGSWVGNTWQHGKWIQLDYKFKVIGGALKDWSESPLTSIQISSNLTGKVMRIYNAAKDNAGDFLGTPQDGQYTQVKDAWLTIRTLKPDGQGGHYIDWNDWSDAKWVNTGNTGVFTAMLSQGKYKIIDAGGPNFWMKLDIPFEINAQGNLVDSINDTLQQADDYVVGGMLVVKTLPPNFKGIAYRDEGKTQVVRWGNIVVKPASAKEHEWNNAIWIPTKEDGSFEQTIPQGEWKITEISGPSFWFRVSIPISVASNGAVTSTMAGVVNNGTVTIAPPQANLTGIVKDKNGNVLNEQAWITVKPANAKEFEWNQAFGMEYKLYGSEYSVRTYLQQGEYRVVDVGSMSSWYKTDIRFNIDANGQLVEVDPGTVDPDGKLIIAPPPPNLTGTAFIGSTNSGGAINKGWIGVARFDANGSQLTIEGEAITSANTYGFEWKRPEDPVFWQHTRWMEINASGQFEFRLPNGKYKVIVVDGQNGEGGWVRYEPDMSFDIVNGQTTNIEVTAPSANVTITVSNPGVTDDYAWMEIKGTTSDGKAFVMPVQSNQHQLGDTTYTFTVKLKNGSYTINSFASPNAWVPLDTSLVVDGIETVAIDLNAQTTKAVGGSIVNNGTPISERAWIAILPVVGGVVDTSAEKKWVETNDIGQFQFKLNEGGEWAVVNVSTSTGFIDVSNPLNYSYTVNSNNAQPGAWNIDLSLLP